MDKSGTTEYGLSAGVALATSLARAGLYIFTTARAAELAPQGVDPQRVRFLLKSLTDAGWIVRLRRDLYAGTGRLPGGVDVPPFVIATAMVTPSAISHLSALAYHDLTDQIPRVVTVSTPRKVVTPSMRRKSDSGETARHLWRVAGVECRYVTVIPKRFELGLETVWLEERFRVAITDRERTVLDLFAMPRLFGGVSEGLSVVERSLDVLDLERLVHYAVMYDSVAVAKRLGWSLEQVGVETSVLMPLLELGSPHYSPLDPGLPRRGPRDSRWKLILNLREGPTGG